MQVTVRNAEADMRSIRGEATWPSEPAENSSRSECLDAEQRSEAILVCWCDRELVLLTIQVVHKESCSRAAK